MEDSLLFYQKEGKPEEKMYKVLFTGLDGAGKTSIILALQREFSKIALIEPTKSAQRTIFKFLGREISEWDLGGQKSYRISYLKNPGKFFDDTEVAIYVIDILDDSRTIESLSYLYDVIKKFKQLKIEPPINIFFHKCDPKIMLSIKKEIDNYIQELKKEILETVDYKKIHFFNTSIYDPYTIVSTMSKIFLELYPKSQLIQKTIEEFARKLYCDALLIIDKNSIILGSSFKDEDSKKVLGGSVAYFLSLNDIFEDMELQNQEDQIIVKIGENNFLFKPVTSHKMTLLYYMLVLKKHDPFDLTNLNENFRAFVNIFNDIIKN